MPIDIKSARHDAAALYRFVDTVCALAESRSPSVYVEASEDFFGYVRSLGSKTKEYLTSFPDGLPRDSFLRMIYRQKLNALHNGWMELHKFVKPAADADTLNTPFSLLGVFYRRFDKTARVENVKFAVFHIDELNYLQVRASWFSELAAKLGSQIPDAPVFPRDLGLIGIPYSQSSAIFLNALIPHEMGHFVFQRLQKSIELRPLINQCLDAVLDQATPIAERRWCFDKLASWAEEIFCDLFAIWMAGPAYIFAYIEAFDLAAIPDLSAANSASRADLLFARHHPADACRLAQHLKFLRRLGWWLHVKSFETHYVEALKSVETIRPDEFSFPDHPSLGPACVEAFFHLLPHLEAVLESVVEISQADSVDYARHAEAIESYFHAGVVPSTVLVGDAFETPSPIAVLNVAYKIHLCSIDIVLSQLDEDATKVASRSKWTKRLELWTAKAFEDYSILDTGKVKGGLSGGCII